MALTPISPIVIPGGSTAPDLATAINALIDQRITSATYSTGQVTLTTDDGSSIILAAPHCPEGVASGMAVTRTAALSYQVQAGNYQFGEVVYTAVLTNISLDAPDATNARIDLIIGNNAGTVSKVTGTPAASPSVPAMPANSVSLYQVYVESAGGTDRILAASSVTSMIQQAWEVVGGQLANQFPQGPGESSVKDIAANENMDVTAKIQRVDTSAGAPIAITLPADPNDIKDQTFIFIDAGGAAGTDSIILDGNTNNVNGAASQSISVNYGALNLTSNGTEYYVW